MSKIWKYVYVLDLEITQEDSDLGEGLQTIVSPEKIPSSGLFIVDYKTREAQEETVVYTDEAIDGEIPVAGSMTTAGIS